MRGGSAEWDNQPHGGMGWGGVDGGTGKIGSLGEAAFETATHPPTAVMYNKGVGVLARNGKSQGRLARTEVVGWQGRLFEDKATLITRVYPP